MSKFLVSGMALAMENALLKLDVSNFHRISSLYLYMSNLAFKQMQYVAHLIVCVQIIFNATRRMGMMASSLLSGKNRREKHRRLFYKGGNFRALGTRVVLQQSINQLMHRHLKLDFDFLVTVAGQSFA